MIAERRSLYTCCRPAVDCGRMAIRLLLWVLFFVLLLLAVFLAWAFFGPGFNPVNVIVE